MTQRHAVVVGGGIGGLSAAVGLRRAGWRVSVMERAAEFGEIGAGITVWPNALRALEALGLEDRLAPLMAPQQSGGLRDQHGRWLTEWDATEFERRLGHPLVAVHRARLLDVLRDALPADALHTGAEVADDTTLDADLVVGADGIHSGLRARYWPSHPGLVYSGSTAFRAVTALTGRARLGTTMGPGAEAGIVPLSDGRLYWYLSFLAAEGERHEDPKAFLRERFSGWHAPYPELIEATDADQISHHDLHHLKEPLPSYVSGRVALLGDAAHAMTPHLGQGGCQAIEDAAVLAAAVSRFDAVSDALVYYDEQRRPRTQSIAALSRKVGRFGPQLRNPVAVAVRNLAIRAIPSRLSVRTSASVADWTPPVIPPSVG